MQDRDKISAVANFLFGIEDNPKSFKVVILGMLKGALIATGLLILFIMFVGWMGVIEAFQLFWSSFNPESNFFGFNILFILLGAWKGLIGDSFFSFKNWNHINSYDDDWNHINRHDDDWNCFHDHDGPDTTGFRNPACGTIDE